MTRYICLECQNVQTSKGEPDNCLRCGFINWSAVDFECADCERLVSEHEAKRDGFADLRQGLVCAECADLRQFPYFDVAPGLYD